MVSALQTSDTTSPSALAWRWYLVTFCRNLVLIYPVYALMISAAGVGAWGLAWLFVIWSLAAVTFQVPAGVIADRFNRRHILIGASLIKSSGFLVWWLWPDYAGFALGFVLWGAGSAFWSGTAEAWLYEVLQNRGQVVTYARVYGRGRAADNLGVVLALAAGGAAAEWGFAVPLLASIVSSALIALLIWVLLPDSGRTGTVQALSESQAPDDGVDAPPLHQALHEFRVDAGVRYLASGLILATVGYGVYEEYVPLVLEAYGFRVGLIGLLVALCYLARSFGMLVAPHVGIPGPLTSLAVSGILLLLAALAPAWWYVVGLGLFFVLTAMAELRFMDALQRQMSGKARATVVSLAAVGMELGAVLLYLFIGGLAAALGWHQASVATALLLLILVAPLVWLRRA